MPTKNDVYKLADVYLDLDGQRHIVVNFGGPIPDLDMLSENVQACAEAFEKAGIIADASTISFKDFSRTVFQWLYFYAPNNWLKMHGYPLRRKWWRWRKR